MWGVVYKILSDELGYTCDEIHEIMKAKFLKEWVTIKTKDKAEEVEVVKSTTSLKTNEMEAYLDRIRQWAAIDFGISNPLPNEVEHETNTY
jgi:methylaspartate ammonia-lyase